MSDEERRPRCNPNTQMEGSEPGRPIQWVLAGVPVGVEMAL